MVNKIYMNIFKSSNIALRLKFSNITAFAGATSAVVAMVFKRILGRSHFQNHVTLIDHDRFFRIHRRNFKLYMTFYYSSLRPVIRILIRACHCCRYTLTSQKLREKLEQKSFGKIQEKKYTSNNIQLVGSHIFQVDS